MNEFEQKGKNFLSGEIHQRLHYYVMYCVFCPTTCVVCVQAPLQQGGLSSPLVCKGTRQHTHGADAREDDEWTTGHEERTREKMKEILEQLWRDFCFEQNIESGPICMADVADFFDYVELMTDTFADDGK